MLAEKLSGGAAAAVTYVDDVFSTYLYTGNGSTQTINNGIDLAGKGGLVWFKSRSAATRNGLYDTSRGTSQYIVTNSTAAGVSLAGLSSFNSNGFTIGTVDGAICSSGDSLVSWTFRKAAKFFDVVTWTGTGSARTIAHNLGSTPGCIIVKRTDTTGNWQVYHNGLTSAEYSIQLNLTSAQASATTVWNSTAPTSSVFSVGTDATVNASGGTYVAYLFAHDTSSTGLIQCGSFTTDASGNAQFNNLGWEPQWMMFKRASGVENWNVIDNMRGMPLPTNGTAGLSPNTSAAEVPVAFVTTLSATGNQFYPTTLTSSSTYIYIAIRRPNKPPTSGTQVYNATTYAGNNTNKDITGVGFAADLLINRPRNNTLASGNIGLFFDRLRGFETKALWSTGTTDETSIASLLTMFGYLTNGNANPQDGYRVVNGSTDGRYVNYSSESVGYVTHAFKRAPGFMDVVAYTGTGVARTVNHGLGVVPELMIVKDRSATGFWRVYSATLGNTQGLSLNATDGAYSAGTYWDTTTPTSTGFRVNATATNTSGDNYIAYLFATLAGISKVGSYTGNGTSQTINCGFAAGARFILIKCTSTTGDWKVIDSARGIVAGNDPTLALNSAAAEVTGTDCIDPDSSGFIVNQESTNNLNVNGATYIFLSIS